MLCVFLDSQSSPDKRHILQNDGRDVAFKKGQDVTIQDAELELFRKSWGCIFIVLLRDIGLQMMHDCQESTARSMH